MVESNALYYGDNLGVLRRHVKDQSVDLVYLDPPFNSNATYNVLFAEADGSRPAAQIKAFEDTWTWDRAAQAAFDEVIEGGGEIAVALQSLHRLLGPSNMLAYLAMMAPRLIELKRVLKPDGSIFLHCDPTASHYLKLLMDATFDVRHFRNEIVWCYYGPGSPNIRQFMRKHDIVLWYSRGDEWTFNRDAVRIPHSDKTAANFKEGLRGSGFVEDETLGGADVLHTEGKVPEDWWVIAIAPRSKTEYLGYPTQKPRALLERIIKASSNRGDVVLDPFCGCGTTIDAAERHGRRWIGIDVTHLAVGLIKHRLADTFGDKVDYDVVGEPTDVEGARQLASEDRFQFQAWALGLVGARTASSDKKGWDKGMDGKLLYKDGAEVQTVVLSVKSGKPKATDIRDLRAVVDREDATIGALITLDPPTKPQLTEAASAGMHESLDWGRFPRLQILEIQDLIDGKTRLEMPPRGADATRRRAEAFQAEVDADQLKL